MNNKTFPSNFVWGTATSSFQVESHYLTDGAGESLWSDFVTKPGRISNDGRPNLSPDQFNKYKEDVQLMKWMNTNAYRFSIAWPRIFPEGTGKVNPKAFDYYDKLIDELLTNGITPWVTLFHWDLPLELEKRYGGWRSKDTAKAFAEYVQYVVSKISDRVTNFFTINEVQAFTQFAYGMGYFPPRLCLSKKETAQTIHNGLLAHGLGLEAARAAAVQPISVGLAENLIPVTPYIDKAEEVAACKKALREVNADRLTVILEGKYLESWLEEVGDDAPEYTDDEMKLIGAPLDFLGINVYTPAYYRANENSEKGYSAIRWPEKYPTLDMDWIHLGPEVLYWLPRLVSEVWSVENIYISEFGGACRDAIDDHSGNIYDLDRVMQFRYGLREASRAIKEGVPLKGIFAWSLIDNFEWCVGFTKRFGLVYVDYFNDNKRIPKASAEYYRNVISENRIL